jgi:sarcosine oxidase
MPYIYDAIVVGLGAHGSAAAYHLAKRGLDVLGIERFPRGHTLGSSGGLSRIIRLSYYEHPDYVPLLRSAWELWRELEQESRETLLTQTGGLYLGPRDGELVAGSLASARAHGLSHELVAADEVRRRWPVFEVENDWVGLLDEQAGWLAPERAIEAHLLMAAKYGAALRFDEPIESWERYGDGVRVTSENGSHLAKRLVLTAGAWMSRLLPDLARYLWVERSVLFWFEPTADREAFTKLPVYIVQEPERMFYGFPLDAENGVKVAGLHFGDRANPDTLARHPSRADEERVRTWLAKRMPLANGQRRLAKVCMYTNSPDGHFVIDHVPDAPAVFASACSGHGFKFASAIGELLAVMATTPAKAPAFLRAGRLTGAAARS